MMRVFLQRIFAMIMLIITFLTGGAFGTKKTIDEITVPTIYVEDVEINRNDSTATVKIYIVKNPGIAGAIITASFDEKLTLIKAESGSAFSSLQYMSPGKLSNPCNFSWDSESGMTSSDGVVLKLTFLMPSEVRYVNRFSVKCSYRDGDIYDENLNDVSLDVINGFIYIK